MHGVTGRGTPSGRVLSLILLGALLPACGTRGNGTLNPTVAPEIPTGVSAVGAPRRVVLSWDRSPAATSYTVRRALTSGGPYSDVPGGTTCPSPSYTDKSLQDGTPYYYVVSARNSFGASPYAPEVKVVPGFKAGQIAGGSETVFSAPNLTGPNDGGFTTALMKDGSVWAWGSNRKGQLGQPLFRALSSVALEVALPIPMLSVSCGDAHCLAVGSDGQAWAWGDNSKNQLGLDVVSSSYTPAVVPGLTGVRVVSAGTQFSLALLTDGTVRAWGWNRSGQLGNGGFSEGSPPV